jgi:hypothetical protein
VAGAFVVSPLPVSAQSQETSSSEGASSSGDSSESSPDSESSSSTGPTPKLALLPTHTINDDISDLVPDRIGEMLRKRIGSDARLELLPTYREMSREDESGGSTSAAIAKARQKYTSGIGLLNAGEFEKASETLQSAVDIMKDNIQHLRDFDVLVDALVKLSRAYFEAGYDFDARKRITEYAHLRPDADLDPETYAEKLRTIYRREARKVEQAGTSTIAVETKAKQATVWIDGKERGEAPIDVSGIPYGYHYLVVQDPRGRFWAKRIQVPGRDRKRTFQVELKASGGQSSTAKSTSSDESSEVEMPAFYTELRDRIGDGSFDRDDVKPYFRELAKRTEADYVAWVSMFREDNRYQAAPFGYRASDDRIVRIDRTNFNVQLSDLRVGVSDMSTNLIETILEMPDDRAVTSVTLVEPDEETSSDAVASTSSSSSSSTASSSTASSASTTSTSTRPTPPPSPPPEPNRGGNRVWTYVGIGGAVLAVGGLVAGGFALFGGGGGSPSQPPGFNANVSW